MKKHVFILSLTISTKCISTMKKKMFLDSAFIGLSGKYQILPKRQMAKGILAICLVLATGCQKESEYLSHIVPADLPVVTDSSLTVRIPTGGNSYITAGSDSGAIIKYKVTNHESYGLQNWKDSSTVISTYIKLHSTGVLNLGIRTKVTTPGSQIKLSVNGKSFVQTIMPGSDTTNYYLGAVNITDTGYVKIDLQGVDRTGDVFMDVPEILVGGSATGNNVTYVKTPDEKSGFLYARRGVSLNLYYTMPSGNYEYMYHEVSIPKGYDIDNMYVMSNGFEGGGGYAGMQIVDGKRKVLFSVWDPADMTNGGTVIVDKGSDLENGNFGGEGTGAKCSFLVDWKTDLVYKFITRIRPDGNGNTLYSCWFYDPERGSWKYLATFRKPLTNAYVTKPYSFLEHFKNYDSYRATAKAYYSNMWFKGSTGNWVPASGPWMKDFKNPSRLDYKTGFDSKGYYMMHNGFFNDGGTILDKFHFPEAPTPEVDVNTLPTR